MKRVFWFVIAIFLCLPGLSPEAKDTKSKKVSKKNTPLFRTLTLAQIARLEYSDGIRYVKLFRQTYLELEKTQHLFRFGKLIAQNDLKKKNPSLYALVFGPDAYAQEAQGRGRSVMDRCIYAYRVSDYGGDTSAAGQPYLCERSQGGNCTPGNPVNTQADAVGSGALCRQELSGLDPRDSEHCIPYRNRWKSTVECENIREDKEARYRARPTSCEAPATVFGSSTPVCLSRSELAIHRAQEVFNIHPPAISGKVSRSTLTSGNAREALKLLIDHSFDAEAHYNLLVIAELYKKAGLEFPFSAEEKQKHPYQDMTVGNLNRLMSTEGNVVEASWREVYNYCEATVSADELRRLTDNDCFDRFRGSNGEVVLPGWLQGEERKKCEAAKRIDDIKNGRAPAFVDPMIPNYCDPRRRSPGPNEFTAENILQADECGVMKRRVNVLCRGYNDTISSLPDVVNTPDGSRPNPNPSRPEPTRIHTGCSSDVVRDEALLFHHSARCLICPAEDVTGKPVSRKWMSLLTTMVQACGEGDFREAGVRDGKHDYVTLQSLQKYIHTFGHCGGEDVAYEWEDRPMTQADFDKVQEWQTHNFWNKDGRRCRRKAEDFPDVDSNFSAIYGISYTAATKLFCDPDRFRRKFFSQKPKCYDEKDMQGLGNLTETELSYFMAGGRDRVSEAKIPGSSSVTQGFKRCMADSLNVAEQNYSNSNSCLGFQRLANQNAFDGMVRDVKNGDGVILSDGGLCFNAKTHETLGADERIAFAPTSEISDQYEFQRAIPTPGQPGGGFTDLTVHVKPTRKIGDSTNMTYYETSYRNRNSCPIPNGNGNYDEMVEDYGSAARKEQRQENRNTR